ncbi:heat shock transcription factor, X-linked member 3-like [Diceros bicornis minor]|uniref:heat shock transcription factor, X-linked member 3-like n=1 Tax=Diceros bicornis minor TaxID=77932 RepID=UPI0026F22536|nr:heat shock transcription factor, X-linked member 3-like [Diceros bicornis minor]
MASQSTDQIDQVELAPSGNGESAIGVPSNSSLVPNLDSREVLENHSDQAMSQDPGPQDDPRPQDPNQGTAHVEENDLLGLSFPRKLWMLAEDSAFTSVRWNDDGDTVIIEEDLFQREILNRRGAARIFETDSLKTFIRQLNLHGFSKIRSDNSSAHSPGNKRIMIYRNPNFQRHKPLLIENIRRRGDLRIIACPGTSATTPKRKKQVAATRHSPRIHRNEPTKETNKKAQKEAPNAQGPSGSWWFTCSGICSVTCVARRAMGNHHPSEPGSPSGEGPSRNDMFVPLATARRDGIGEPPASPPDYSDYDFVMSLYNTCYFILLAALSVMSAYEAPDEDEEQEGSSDHKRVLCEQCKDNPGP